jgi:hypothetical protein
MMTDLPDLSERPFAAQKAALMPIQTMYTGIKVVDKRIDALRKDMEDNYDGYNGSVVANDVVQVPQTGRIYSQGNSILPTEATCCTGIDSPRNVRNR